jgi:putative transposase
MRKIPITTGEYYHIYNRGVDKRSIFVDKQDALRFLQSMEVFNSEENTGSIYLDSRKKTLRSRAPRLVTFIVYCLNQNHYHFIMKSLVENGIQKFMHRLGTGYTNFFNEKYKRSGSLFQGKYKAVHIKTNEQLLHTGAYVNINDRVHPDLNESWMQEIPFSSLQEYQGLRTGICDISIILDQYASREEYCNGLENILRDIIKRKEQEKSLKKLLLE